jgi:HD-like signal output (HDOD) protein
MSPEKNLTAMLIVLAVAVAAGLLWWRLRRRSAGSGTTAAAVPATAQPPHAAAPPAAAVPAGAAIAPVAAANTIATDRLWRRAFGPAPETPVKDPAEAGLRAEIFTALRAENLDPRYFPRRPALMAQLLHAFEDDQSGSDQVARIIGHDPVLTADVLRLANSTLYRTSPEPIGTIQRAVVVCGTEELRRLVATAMLLPVFRATRTNFPRFPRLLWERTERAARAAEMYAGHYNPADRFEAQMVALLSALGPLVVYGAALDLHARAPQVPPNPETFLALLHDLSAPMSQRLAKQWDAAPRIVAALSRDPAERLTVALLAGELLASLSVLESQTVITSEELAQTASAAGIPDARVFEIAPRLAVKG